MIDLGYFWGRFLRAQARKSEGVEEVGGVWAFFLS